MTKRQRLAYFLCAGVFVLGLAAIALIFGGDQAEETPSGTSQSEAPPATAVPSSPEEAAAELARRQERRERERFGGHNDDPREVPAGERTVLRTTAEMIRLTSPVGERFYRAFARYELGELAPGVRAELEATATPAFARELLRMPPRVPPAAGDAATAARLVGDWSFVVTRSNTAREAVVAGELVGAVRRGGMPPTPLVVEVERTDDGWRVAGVR